MQVKNIVIAILLLVLLGMVGYLFMNPNEETYIAPAETDEEVMPVEPDGGIGDGAEPLDQVLQRQSETVLGQTTGGNEIKAYHYGSGETEIVLIGGIHGGYSWNTALLGYDLVEYFDANESTIPDNITLTIIPVMNPDGLESTVGKAGRFTTADITGVTDATRTAGRFNANKVDLNRNFDCEWSENAVWQNQNVSGGDKPFSENESVAIRNYVSTYNPAAAIVWFSAEGKVYPSACAKAPSNTSVELAATFANAAGYPVEAEFDAYAITGDMVNWLAAQNIPAISVLLTNHTNPETDKNLKGLTAVLNAYAE